MAAHRLTSHPIAFAVLIAAVAASLAFTLPPSCLAAPAQGLRPDRSSGAPTHIQWHQPLQCEWLSTGQLLIGYDQATVVWDLAAPAVAWSGPPVHAELTAAPAGSPLVALHANDSRWSSATQVHLVDFASHRLLRRFGSPKSRYYYVSFSNDGSKLAACDLTGSVFIYDLLSRQFPFQGTVTDLVPDLDPRHLGGIAVSGDAQTFVLAVSDSGAEEQADSGEIDVAIVDRKPATPARVIVVLSPCPIHSVRLVRADDTIYAGLQYRLAVLDLQGRTMVMPIQLWGYRGLPIFSPDGRYIVVQHRPRMPWVRGAVTAYELTAQLRPVRRGSIELDKGEEPDCALDASARKLCLCRDAGWLELYSAPHLEALARLWFGSDAKGRQLWIIATPTGAYASNDPAAAGGFLRSGSLPGAPHHVRWHHAPTAIRK